jgi:hypothetical protein
MSDAAPKNHTIWTLVFFIGCSKAEEWRISSQLTSAVNGVYINGRIFIVEAKK